MGAATGDPRFKDRVDRLVDELKSVQDKHGDGYIGAQADRAFAVLVDGVKIGETRIPRRSPQEPEGFFDVE